MVRMSMCSRPAPARPPQTSWVRWSTSSALDISWRSECDTDGDQLGTCGLVALFWERHRGRCFERLVTTDPHQSLVDDNGSVSERVRRLMELLVARQPAKGPVLKIDRARQVLIHYLGAPGDPTTVPTGTPRDHAQALDVRCNFTRAATRDDDHDLVAWYKNRVETDPLARMIEAWMFPAWTGDVPAGGPPITPSRVLLVRTGEELVHEIQAPKYSNAYLHYLASVYLPIALRIDKRLGGNVHHIGDSFRARFEHVPPTDSLERAAAAVSIDS